MQEIKPVTSVIVFWLPMLVLLGVPVSIWLYYRVLNTWINSWFSGLDYNMTNNNKSPTMPIKNYNLPIILFEKERSRPPRAEFFSRLNGENIIEKGKYEEKYLNMWELRHWKKQKQREEELKDGILNKN